LLIAVVSKDESAAFLTTVYGQPEEQEDNEADIEAAIKNEIEQEADSDYHLDRNHLETGDKTTSKEDDNVIPVTVSNDLELSKESPLANTSEQEVVLKTMARSVSTTQILRQKHQYTKIYSNRYWNGILIRKIISCLGS